MGEISSTQESLRQFLDTVAQELPIIRPIKEFVHLNLLLPYQHLPFWEALKIVSTKFEAMPFAEFDFYKNKIREGAIPRAILDRKLNRYIPSVTAEKLVDEIMSSEIDFIHHDLRTGKLHYLWNDDLGVNIIQLADGTLIRWLSMFLDRGISLWQMPGSNELSFYAAVRELLTNSLIKPAPFTKNNLHQFFPEDPEEAIREHLNFLCPEYSFQNEYLRESIFTLRGWAGLVYCLEKNPALIPFRRNITLIDFIAVKLTLERAWILEHDKEASSPDFRKCKKIETTSLLEGYNFELLRACHEALEEATYRSVLSSIKGLINKTPTTTPTYQAVFCMDDRESPFRRHLEELVPSLETFGTAGHFGIECLYQHSDDAFPKKQCPAPMTPKILLRDVSQKANKKQDRLPYHMIQPSHDLVEDLMNTLTGGLRSARDLAINLFFPLAFKNLSNVREVTPDSELKLLDEGEGVTAEGLKLGLSIEEMAKIVFQQLQLIGFVHQFAPLIFIIGHGSNSANNPYFATYGCGACSGRPGSANARAFAQLANTAEVREVIKRSYGLSIPETTTFVAGFHDTCRDVVTLFNPEKIPDVSKAPYLNFKKMLSTALNINARERAESFKRVTYKSLTKSAQKEVIRRSYSLFETRPELGHTNVAFSIVGPRSMTKGLTFERRSFLQSYDRKIDPTGDILAASLSAVIPVTSGINLDYFFSRVDNLRFGAGSKLPQNIVGHIGVSHGTESDLLFGLPYQMIDQHTPIRILVLVNQSPEKALYAIQKNPMVREIVYNNWIHYACWDEETGAYYYFEKGEMLRTGSMLEGL